VEILWFSQKFAKFHRKAEFPVKTDSSVPRRARPSKQQLNQSFRGGVSQGAKPGNTEILWKSPKTTFSWKFCKFPWKWQNSRKFHFLRVFRVTSTLWKTQQNIGLLASGGGRYRKSAKRGDKSGFEGHFNEMCSI